MGNLVIELIQSKCMTLVDNINNDFPIDQNTTSYLVKNKIQIEKQLVTI